MATPEVSLSSSLVPHLSDEAILTSLPTSFSLENMTKLITPFLNIFFSLAKCKSPTRMQNKKAKSAVTKLRFGENRREEWKKKIRVKIG
jgi:hypothetical protein